MVREFELRLTPQLGFCASAHISKAHGSENLGQREKSVMPPEPISQRTGGEDKSAPGRADATKMGHGKAWRIRVLQLALSM